MDNNLVASLDLESEVAIFYQRLPLARYAVYASDISGQTDARFLIPSANRICISNKIIPRNDTTPFFFLLLSD